MIYLDKNLTKQIIIKLKQNYKDPKTALNWKTGFELLVATILSAQCTDERVNKITPNLFKKYPNSKEMAKAKQNDVEQIIKSCGFYKNKADSIIQSSIKIEKEFNGNIPDNMQDLLKLRGVARKTANIILSSYFKKAEGIAVDTHVARLSKRFFFSFEENSNNIEKDLLQIFDKKEWILANYILVEHGRKVCKAINPNCKGCFLQNLCPSFKSITEKRPYITIKYAQSLDGKIATNTGDSKWISNEKARIFAHKLRKDNDAVLVGINTILKDNPMLDVRFVKGKNPIRVVLDSDFKISKEANIVKTADKIKTIIFTQTNQNKSIKNVEIVKVKDTQNLKNILQILYKKYKIQRLLVEGGGEIITSFVKANLVDKMVVVVAPILIGEKGVSAIKDFNINKIKNAKKFQISNKFEFGDNSIFVLTYL